MDRDMQNQVGALTAGIHFKGRTPLLIVICAVAFAVSFLFGVR